MRKWITLLSLVTFASLAYAHENDPTWFDRPAAERAARDTDYDLQDFYREASYQYGYNSRIARLADYAVSEIGRLSSDIRYDIEYTYISRDYQHFDSVTIRDLANEYNRAPSPSARLRDIASRLNRDLSNLAYAFDNGGGGGGGNDYACIAQDRGYEEHWFILNGTLMFGHGAAGRTQYQAEDAAMRSCGNSHSNCYVTQCWIQKLSRFTVLNPSK